MRRISQQKIVPRDEDKFLSIIKYVFSIISNNIELQLFLNQC